jgi:hypothetical protein
MARVRVPAALARVIAAQQERALKPVTPLRRPGTVPMGAYSQMARMPLQGGYGSAIVGGYGQASGSLTSGAAFSNIVFTGVTQPGFYTIQWTVTLAGTLGGGDANNFRLSLPGSLTQSVNAAAAGSYPQAPVGPVFLAAGAAVGIQTNANTPTVGSVYGGILPGLGIAQVTLGPQGVGTVWYPQQAAIATTTGAVDASTCTLFVGPLALLTQIGSQSYAGGGDSIGLAIAALYPGSFLVAKWSGGVVGDLAAFTVYGLQDVLTVPYGAAGGL